MPKKRDDNEPTFHFEGFDNPNTTPVPDILFDLLAPELTEAELRVLLYIIRRTYGFKKSADDISLKQLVEGITRKDGRVQDRGAGVAKSAASRAVKGLVEKGIITAHRNRSKERGDEPTSYQLRFKDDPVSLTPKEGLSNVPVFSKSTRGGTPREQARVLQENPQETDIQETDVSLSRFERSHDENLEPENEDTPGPRRSSPRQTDRGSRNGNSGQISSLGEILKQREAARSQPAKPDRNGQEIPASTSSAPRQGSATYGTTEEREKLYAYLRDFAAELGDEAQLSSSITQVLKIFHAAHIPIEHWDDHLYRARALTQEHSASITKRSADPARLSGKNKFPYFKRVVMSLVSPE